MENQQKMIGGISINRWKQAFADAAAIAIDKDYFSDILFYDLYPGTYDEYDKAEDEEEDEDAVCDIFNEKWKFVDEAFKEVFGVDRHLA